MHSFSAVAELLVNNCSDWTHIWNLLLSMLFHEHLCTSKSENCKVQLRLGLARVVIFGEMASPHLPPRPGVQNSLSCNAFSPSGPCVRLVCTADPCARMSNGPIIIQCVIIIIIIYYTVCLLSTWPHYYVIHHFIFNFYFILAAVNLLSFLYCHGMHLFTRCSDDMIWANNERARTPGLCVRAWHPASVHWALLLLVFNF